MPLFSHPGVPEKQKDQSQHKGVRKGKKVRKHIHCVGKKLKVESFPGLGRWWHLLCLMRSHQRTLNRRL